MTEQIEEEVEEDNDEADQLSVARMVDEAAARIEKAQSHYAALNAALQYAYDGNYSVSQSLHDSAQPLLRRLQEIELREWKSLFMWALAADPDTMKRVRLIAHNQFFARDCAVIQWRNDGRTPGFYLHADEVEFRKFARDAFLGALDPEDALDPSDSSTDQ